MPSGRLPLRPPPRAVHYAARRDAPAPLCGMHPRGPLHVTPAIHLVTCLRCTAALAASAVPVGVTP